MQMPQKSGGMAQQVPNIQEMFNMGNMGGQRFFWKSGAECVILMKKSKVIQLHNLYPTSPQKNAAKALLATVDINMQNVHEWAILYSGGTTHFLVIEAPTSDRQEAKNPMSVKLPDGVYMGSTHTCTLAIPELPAKARNAHIIPGLAAHSLLSIV